MTVGLRAPDGTSGAIMVNGVDQLKLLADGSLAGIVDPATGVRSKALATMQKFADEFASLQTQNGWMKLPNGLILQWGTTVSIPAGSNANVFFPISFPTATIQAIATAQASANGTTPITAGWQTGNVNSFTLRNLSTVAAQFTWLMLGN